MSGVRTASMSMRITVVAVFLANRPTWVGGPLEDEDIAA